MTTNAADTGQEPSPEFLDALPEHVRDYLVGRQQWGCAPRFRSLREVGEKTGT